MQLIIVDDSPTFRAQLEYLAKQLGHDPLVFDSGDDLWSYSTDHSLDNSLLLMDWEMPGLTGPELCQKIREAYPHQAIHIILVTSRDETASLVDGLSSGADDYVSKPFNRDELTARLSVGFRNILLRQQLYSLNEQRLAAEKLASVAQLASGAAHEINNPLAFIRSNLDYICDHTQLLKELHSLIRDPDNTVEQIKRFVDDNRLSDFIDDLSEVSDESIQGVKRIQSIVEGLLKFNSELGLQNQPLDLKSLLSKLVPESAALSVNEGLVIMADPKQLEKMFKAILDNAEQASNDPSTIEVKGRVSEGVIEISIKDRGVGMSSEQRARAFDPFYTTRPVGSGLGLGLSLAQGIARQHNADLYIDSHQGIGTTVMFRCHAA